MAIPLPPVAGAKPAAPARRAAPRLAPPLAYSCAGAGRAGGGCGCAGGTWPRSHIFWTGEAVHRGDPPAAFEAERVEWVPLAQVPSLIADGKIPAAVTAAALLYLPHTRRD
jgi:hypothetical protein